MQMIIPVLSCKGSSWKECHLWTQGPFVWGWGRIIQLPGSSPAHFQEIQPGGRVPLRTGLGWNLYHPCPHLISWIQSPGQLITAWPNVHTNHMVDICDHKALKIFPGRHAGQGQVGNGPRIEGNRVRARMKNGVLPHSLWVVSSRGTGSSSVSPSLNHPIVGIKDPSWLQIPARGCDWLGEVDLAHTQLG